MAVIVGDDGASSVYVSNKTKVAQKCGITATTKKLGKETTQQELLDLVDSLNKDNKVSNLAQLFYVYTKYRLLMISNQWTSLHCKTGSVVTSV